MKELLPLFPHPSHYLGNELNSVHKESAQIQLRWCLAFPDLYEIGMSHLGQRLLYHILNSDSSIWAERVFAPLPEVADLLRHYKSCLCTLESDTPLIDMDILGFSLSHELCYTTVLYILDLAGIPFFSEERTEQHPLVIGGGGSTYNPEPIAPFFDCFVIGEGEEIVLELSQALIQAKESRSSRQIILDTLSQLPGIYIPKRLKESGSAHSLPINNQACRSIPKRVIKDINTIEYPTKQIIPYGKVIHDRLTLEIARGCTRGCRFCQAGMTYRPVRERSLGQLDRILQRGLQDTGYEEFSFLSLSTGDFSALDELFAQSFTRCRQEQVSISLPSLRVGSFNPRLYTLLSDLRRTGATFAPEAGSQRLRDVINKGISESELLSDTSNLFHLGWQKIKLYFMIGLPTETDEDIYAIFDLCKKVLTTAAPRSGKILVTAHISPFVPKPHTPFQWERQSPLEEIQAKLALLQRLFRAEKKLKLRWHQPEMSILEGVFSRGDRRLSSCIQAAYKQGEILTSWQEHCHFATWEHIFQKEKIDVSSYLGPREIKSSLPWEHISAGVSVNFLYTEYLRSKEHRPTPDCRYHPCQHCGVCQNHKSDQSHKSQKEIAPHVIHPQKKYLNDLPESENAQWRDLYNKKNMYCLWYSKEGPAKYLSQLELSTYFERFLRRANIPLTFTQGYHPSPIISFGRALPVGVASKMEWYLFATRSILPSWQVYQMLQTTASIPGIDLLEVETLVPSTKPTLSTFEEFELTFFCSQEKTQQYQEQWNAFFQKKEFLYQKKTKKGKKTLNIRAYVARVENIFSTKTTRLVFNWQQGYLNPLTILYAVNSGIDPLVFEFCKTKQYPQDTIFFTDNDTLRLENPEIQA